MHRVSPSSPEEIHVLIAAALNAGDLDAFVALHEEGATTLVPPDGQPVSGREAIRAALAPMFALRPSARIEVVGKLEADGLALTHARLNVVAGRGRRRPGSIRPRNHRLPTPSGRQLAHRPRQPDDPRVRHDRHARTRAAGDGGGAPRQRSATTRLRPPAFAA